MLCISTFMHTGLHGLLKLECIGSDTQVPGFTWLANPFENNFSNWKVSLFIEAFEPFLSWNHPKESVKHWIRMDTKWCTSFKIIYNLMHSIFLVQVKTQWLYIITKALPFEPLCHRMYSSFSSIANPSSDDWTWRAQTNACNMTNARR